MRLGVIFVTTLAVSVILSSTSTWGLTYTTSYSELQDMSSGFVGLATASVGDFAQLVWALIDDSGALVSNVLNTEYERSTTQLNETGEQFLQTTMELMSRARNTTTQAQDLLIALVVSFGSFMGSVITDFKAMGTDYASRLRTESASRTQAIFSNLLQDRIFSIQRQARLYELGVLNFSRPASQPMDDGSCTLLGSLCAASAEIKNDMYIATADGAMMLCDVSGTTYSLSITQNSSGDTYSWANYPPYISDFPAWKQSCMAGPNSSDLIAVCPNGTALKQWPTCNGCGYDPRCRPWYIHDSSGSPKTYMSDVYFDLYKLVPVVTLIYPIYSSTLHRQVGIAATDFYFSDLDSYLSTVSSSQLAVVIFNSSDLLVVGTNRACSDASQQRSGVPIAQVCDPVLRGLGGWLAKNQGLGQNVSLELNGTLWDVFPGTVDSFSYFVAVGMNKTEVYAVITAASQEANDTLRTMSQQQSAQMAAMENASLMEMDAVSKQKIAELEAMQLQLQVHMKEVHNQTEVAFNASRKKSTRDLSSLISTEMSAIDQLESYHLSRVVNSIGTTFGAVVGIFMAILLLGSYGTWAVTKQVQQIAQVMEDVAHMRVEELQVSQKSSIREVQRIEAALGVLVLRLAEYKSYMPAGLFQRLESESASVPDPCISPTILVEAVRKRDPLSAADSASNSRSSISPSVDSRAPSVRAAPVAGSSRLLRRSVTVMAVNVVHFQGEMAQRSAAHLEGMLNRLISTVHGLASKSQGNIDSIIGDQVLVTFNAHFTCSDPPSAAASVALDLVGALKADSTFPQRVQVGLAAGSVFVGHLGYASFKAMVALGPSMKVASVLSHLSGFHESAILACPLVEERIKYHFILQPADMVMLPMLGEHVALYSRSVSIFILEGKLSAKQETEEWLYQVNSAASIGDWAAVFTEITKAHSLDKVLADLRNYLTQHPQDCLAQRLLARLPYWQPRTGIVLAERPDVPREAAAACADSPFLLPISMSGLTLEK